MDNKDRLKQLINIKGPVIPSDVYSELGLNILMTSATMAELVSNNILKISAVKIGSSPLYYLPGQENMLQQFSKHLHEKAKKAYDILKNKKILKDSDLEPVIRVALREIKDFAIPLKVNYENKSEIFWKWYLLPNEDAQSSIKKHLKLGDEKKEIKIPSKKENLMKKQEIKKEETIIKKTDIKKQKPFINQTTPFKKTETIKKSVSEKSKALFDNLYDYFNKNNIFIVRKEINKRKTSGDFIVEVPTPVGKLTYFCRVKDKKSINDSELASAFVQGQQNKLPVLFITSGRLTKKAKEMLNKEFKGMNLKQL